MHKQNVEHFKLHHKTNNIVGGVLSIAIIAVIIMNSAKTEVTNQPIGDRANPTPCGCSDDVNKKFIGVGIIMLLATIIIWTLNCFAIESARRVVVDSTVDEVNSHNIN